MNDRQVRAVLWSVSGVLSCAAVAAMGWAAAVPLDIDAGGALQASGASISPVASEAPVEALPPVEDFSVVWRKPVRAALYPEAAQAEPVSKPRPHTPPPPPLRIKLLATAIEPGRCYAVLLSDRDMIEVKRVGESCGGAEVTAIETDRVVVQYQGRSITLAIPEVYGHPEPPPPASRRRPG